MHDKQSALLVVTEERGMALAIALWMVTILYLLAVVILSAASTESTITSNGVKSSQAFGAAEAGVEHARRQLVNTDVDTLLQGGGALFNGQVLGEGSYNVTVSNNITPAFPRGRIPADPGGAIDETDEFLVITSTGTSKNVSRIIEAVVRFPYPPGVKGAVTTNGSTATSGALVTDGRDHDSNGVVIANTGTYGVFTASTYIQTCCDSNVGGTDTTGTDHIPTNPGDPSVIVENSTDPMPTTPDEVMGLSAGELKAIAMSGINSSQYVTDPTTLTYPLSGVTYVEIPSGDTWFPPTIDGSGILIVHNSTTDAVVKNLNAGTFKGLLIADDIVHIHADIIGAVISLTPSSSSGNVIGNGSGRILYSRQALANAMEAASQSYSIRSWHEL
ncbi:MAG: hypothetical protein ACE5MG_12670 [Candidatus Methylomirabilales bacterium]